MTWTIDHLQLAIPKGGEDQARAFWVTCLGLTEVEKPLALKPRGGLWLTAGALQLHLGVDTPFTPAIKAHPCFRVPDLDTLATRLTSAGHSIQWDTRIADRRRFFATDPFGNRIEFT